jgi:hypothetical protein
VCLGGLRGFGGLFLLGFSFYLFLEGEGRVSGEMGKGWVGRVERTWGTGY